MEPYIELRDAASLEHAEIEHVAMEMLPVFDDTTGIYPFYAPQKSGKTVLASKFCARILKSNIVSTVYCFCPVARREWTLLKQVCDMRRVGFRFIHDNFEVAMIALLQLREADHKKGRTGKVMLIWDDMMAAVDMRRSPWDDIARTMACKARHAEVNIIWVILSQDPTACLPIIRDNSTMTFFSNCSKRAVEYVMEAVSDDIDEIEIRRRAHKFQFICYDHYQKKIYCTKVPLR